MAFFLLASAFGITALPPIFSKTHRVLWLVEAELGDKAGVEKLAWGKQKQNFPFSLEYTFKEEIQNPWQVQGKPVWFTSLPARPTKLREGWFSPASTHSPPAHIPQTEQAAQAGGQDRMCVMLEEGTSGHESCPRHANQASFSPPC